VIITHNTHNTILQLRTPEIELPCKTTETSSNYDENFSSHGLGQRRVTCQQCPWYSDLFLCPNSELQYKEKCPVPSESHSL